MPTNLKARLARIRATGGGASAPRVSAVDGGEGLASAISPSALRGWERLDEHVYSRELRSPLGHLLLPDIYDPRPFLPLSTLRAARDTGSADGNERLPVARLRFFDLETTGLSGGSGTVAFLAAIGRVEGEDIALRQLFLSDYPGEPAFIAAVLDCLGEGAIVASYNGRAFDMPLLRTRCVMNGLVPIDAPQLDLLYAARRLWRPVHGGASLGLLEQRVLGKSRGEDVPGCLVPDVWFSFLRQGEDPRLGAVFSHNADDVASLALLFGAMLGVYADPRAAAESGGVDARGLGLSLLALGLAAEGEAILETAASRGDERAALVLCRRLGRLGRQEDRGRIVAMLGGSYEALVERAKYLEHGLGDLKGALACVSAAEREKHSAGADEALMRRKRRLKRKLMASRSA
jgi:uncharacterized protein YprB with RNaseH-like and TPR domain